MTINYVIPYYTTLSQVTSELCWIVSCKAQFSFTIYVLVYGDLFWQVYQVKNNIVCKIRVSNPQRTM